MKTNKHFFVCMTTLLYFKPLQALVPSTVPQSHDCFESLPEMSVAHSIYTLQSPYLQILSGLDKCSKQNWVGRVNHEQKRKCSTKNKGYIRRALLFNKAFTFQNLNRLNRPDSSSARARVDRVPRRGQTSHHLARGVHFPKREQTWAFVKVKHSSRWIWVRTHVYVDGLVMSQSMKPSWMVSSCCVKLRNKLCKNRGHVRYAQWSSLLSVSVPLRFAPGRCGNPRRTGGCLWHRDSSFVSLSTT